MNFNMLGDCSRCSKLCDGRPTLYNHPSRSRPLQSIAQEK